MSVCSCSCFCIFHAPCCIALRFLLSKKGGNNQKEKVERLDEHMQEWYKKTKCPSKIQGKLTVDRLRTKKGWPKLKAKAAATRHLARNALELCIMFCGGSTHDKQMRVVAQLLVRFYELLNQETMFMGEAAKTEIQKLGFRMCMLYSTLADASLRLGTKLWKTSPKLHLFIHLCEWQAVQFGNPRYFWTYADEDLVGQLIDIAETVHPSTLAVSCLFKWLHTVFVEE